ncbi:unnamed protein product [Protopolystoma xenopodis]|uniref:Uncharacterized protein n=1 Tax=Protopolystoma xenopodis TaxID=117903 RepID=A0A448XEA1_9PLAT|nr:unnamed protein product [Protopolystoma xenopodis]
MTPETRVTTAECISLSRDEPMQARCVRPFSESGPQTSIMQYFNAAIYSRFRLNFNSFCLTLSDMLPLVPDAGFQFTSQSAGPRGLREC